MTVSIEDCNDIFGINDDKHVEDKRNKDIIEDDNDVLNDKMEEDDSTIEDKNEETKVATSYKKCINNEEGDNNSNEMSEEHSDGDNVYHDCFDDDIVNNHGAYDIEMSNDDNDEKQDDIMETIPTLKIEENMNKTIPNTLNETTICNQTLQTKSIINIDFDNSNTPMPSMIQPLTRTGNDLLGDIQNLYEKEIKLDANSMDNYVQIMNSELEEKEERSILICESSLFQYICDNNKYKGCDRRLNDIAKRTLLDNVNENSRKTFIIPVCNGNHWILIVWLIELNNSIYRNKICYINTLGEYDMCEFKSEIYNFIIRNMKKVIIDQNDVNTFTQLDGWKCGYHIMNIIRTLVNNKNYLDELESIPTVIEQQKRVKGDNYLSAIFESTK